MHGHTTPRPSNSDPTAARIADLSDTWLGLYFAGDRIGADRIGAEIAGLISGRIMPMTRQS